MAFYVFFKALELEKPKVVIILKKTSGGMNWKNPDTSFDPIEDYLRTTPSVDFIY